MVRQLKTFYLNCGAYNDTCTVAARQLCCKVQDTHEALLDWCLDLCEAA